MVSFALTGVGQVVIRSPLLYPTELWAHLFIYINRTALLLLITHTSWYVLKSLIRHSKIPHVKG